MARNTKTQQSKGQGQYRKGTKTREIYDWYWAPENNRAEAVPEAHRRLKALGLTKAEAIDFLCPVEP